MVALPPANATQISDLEPNALSAYNICLDFERAAKTDNDTIHARLLGYLIIHAPSLDARHEVVKVIQSWSQNYDTLSELGQSFIDYFVRPFKKSKGRTPASSYSPSRSSFDKDKMDQMTTTQGAPKDHKSAKAQALIRDGFRCVLTGKYDLQAARVPSINEEEMRRAGAVFTGCVHIVPESTYFDMSTEKKDFSASVLAVLKRFGYDVESLNGPKVHSLFNVMTMEHNVHDWFDRFYIWFEATDVKNCYRIKTVDEYIGFLDVPEKTTLTSSDPATLPVPSPELLALHATCVKVAYLSGAGAYIDKLDGELDELDVLACDGGSFDVLNHAILKSMIHSVDARA